MKSITDLKLPVTIRIGFELNWKILRKACTVAAMVGTVLLLINQFDALFGNASFRLLPATLTYCVPFVVFLAGRLSKRED